MKIMNDAEKLRVMKILILNLRNDNGDYDCESLWVIAKLCVEYNLTLQLNDKREITVIQND